MVAPWSIGADVLPGAKFDDALMPWNESNNFALDKRPDGVAGPSRWLGSDDNDVGSAEMGTLFRGAAGR